MQKLWSFCILTSTTPIRSFLELFCAAAANFPINVQRGQEGAVQDTSMVSKVINSHTYTVKIRKSFLICFDRQQRAGVEMVVNILEINKSTSFFPETLGRFSKCVQLRSFSKHL